MKETLTCSFFGHREIEVTDELYSTLSLEISRAIKLGHTVFYFGGYGAFDELCYKIVTQFKGEQPNLNIKRIYCVAQERYLRKSSRYFNRDDYDDVVYLTPSFEGWYKSIYFRNIAIIDASDTVIFYARERACSGAYKAYKYAKSKKDKAVINLAQEKGCHI